MSSGDETLRWMEDSLGRPVTRAEYIEFIYGDDNAPQPWTYEDELEMPQRFQDFVRWPIKKAPEGA